MTLGAFILLNMGAAVLGVWLSNKHSDWQQKKNQEQDIDLSKWLIMYKTHSDTFASLNTFVHGWDFGGTSKGAVIHVIDATGKLVRVITND